MTESARPKADCSTADADAALVELGRALCTAGYHFVTVTPETHRRVLARDQHAARTLRDVFGHSRPFSPELLPRPMLALAESARILEPAGGLVRSRVRFSTLRDRLFAHSAFPTTSRDAVFFGPDTYRFCAFLERALQPCRRLVDVGCGSGAGGIVVARRAGAVVLSDINPAALRFARVNAALSGARAELIESDALSAVPGPFDAVIANPPYLRDAAARTYRDGGGAFGEGLSLRIARESLSRLERGGRLLLYTGAPILEGEDVLRAALHDLCREAGASFAYEEVDPDVFGEELEQPQYARAERIAAVTLVATRP